MGFAQHEKALRRCSQRILYSGSRKADAGLRLRQKLT